MAAEGSKGGILFEDSGGAEDIKEVVFESVGAAIPVAPGQTSTASKGAENAIRKGYFETYNARRNHRWKANIDKKDGKVRVLYGHLSEPYAGGAENAARSFLKDARMIFGMRENLADLKTLRVAKSHKRHHVKLQQTVNGIPVRGALVLVHANEQGQISMVQNDYRENLQVDNLSLVRREDATRTVLDDLRSHLGSGAIISTPKSEEIIIPYNDGHIIIWKISIPVENPFGLWVYHIDAESGEILYNANEMVSLRKGVGRVYKSTRAWKLKREALVPMKRMFSSAEGMTGGWLYGEHGDIYDFNGNDPFAPDYRFVYNPAIRREKPWFDATTAYFSLNRLWYWWRNRILTKYGPAEPDYFHTLSVPAIVNVGGLCNAFYTPELGDGIPGFVFGNEKACSNSSEDLVLDRSVVSHEYTHAMMDWCGFDAQFGGEVDQYGRAMGEGNADWFAYLYTKSARIGRLAWNWSPEKYLRTLNNSMTYPEDVDDPALGVPEEHYTSQIWGGYLYDLTRAMELTALQFVYQGFYYFTPVGGHLPDQPDFYDAIYAQILAEQDLHDGSSEYAAQAWGSMASRGLNAVLRPTYAHASDYFGTGSPGSDEVAYFMWSFPQVSLIKTSGKVLNAGDTHEYPINITEAGYNLSVLVNANVASMSPSIDLYTTSGEFVVSGTANSSTEASLSLDDVSPGEYVIVLNAVLDQTNTDPDNGKYTIDVSVEAVPIG